VFATIGVVVFIVLLSLMSGGHDISDSGIGWLFAKEVVGGVKMGAGIDWAGFQILRRVDHYQVEILITHALVTAGYALSLNFHLSGTITVVVIGLIIGNGGNKFAMSEKTRQHIYMFWELIDKNLNAVLYVSSTPDSKPALITGWHSGKKYLPFVIFYIDH
jgi:CPA1 family monovalent cation:H+ antiporter